MAIEIIGLSCILHGGGSWCLQKVTSEHESVSYFEGLLNVANTCNATCDAKLVMNLSLTSHWKKEVESLRTMKPNKVCHPCRLSTNIMKHMASKSLLYFVT